MPIAHFEIENQRQALVILADTCMKSVSTEIIWRTARQIVAQCPAKNDLCEIKAVFDAIKTGTPLVPCLRRGVRYCQENPAEDQFVAPHRLLAECENGACTGDCDCTAGLVAALLSSLGFTVGLRAWGRPGADLDHVYAVVKVPKGDDRRVARVLALDTTVESSYVGWEPATGYTVTAWLY